MKHKFAIFAMLLVLQAGDLLSTRLAFAHGAIELNPLVHALGLWQAKLLAILVVALLLIRSTKLRRLWMVVIVYGCIVCWNMLLVAKAR
jgi:hypothetical protein